MSDHAVVVRASEEAAERFPAPLGFDPYTEERRKMQRAAFIAGAIWQASPDKETK